MLGAIVYTVVLIRVSKRESAKVKAEFAAAFAPEPEVKRQGLTVTVLWLLVGLAVVVGGAQVMVRGAVDLARLLGISDAVIGLTVVAVGTSAPELVSTLISAARGDRDIAVGNLLGSSTYNILFILGVTCAVTTGGVVLDEPSLFVDLGLAAAAALLCVPVFYSGRRVSRGEGLLFVGLYFTYLTVLLMLRA